MLLVRPITRRYATFFWPLYQVVICRYLDREGAFMLNRFLDHFTNPWCKCGHRATYHMYPRASACDACECPEMRRKRWF